MNKNAAYRELFTKTEAKVLIPAAKNLMLITKKYDQAIDVLDGFENTEYKFVEVDRPETVLAKLCASLLVNKVVEERTGMEHEFRKLLESKIARTKKFQEEYFGKEIVLNVQAICQIIRTIESMARYCNENELDDDDTTEKIIEVIVTELVLNDCTDAYFFCGDVDEDDDNCYLDSETVEEAIASVEEYLEDLKEKAKELRKVEAKNKAK